MSNIFEVFNNKAKDINLSSIWEHEPVSISEFIEDPSAENDYGECRVKDDFVRICGGGGDCVGIFL